jgi:hypothetical protein
MTAQGTVAVERAVIVALLSIIATGASAWFAFGGGEMESIRADVDKNSGEIARNAEAYGRLEAKIDTLNGRLSSIDTTTQVLSREVEMTREKLAEAVDHWESR